MMNTYEIYIAGSTKIETVRAKNIKTACEDFVKTLSKDALYRVVNSDYATVRYTDNYSISSNYVIMSL